MHIARILSSLLKINLQQALAYRSDTLLSVFLSVFWMGWDLVQLQIIFSNTRSIGGWGIGELIALLGVFRLTNTLMNALIWPNTERFNSSIRDGSFDYNLLQPLNSQFQVTFSRMVIWQSWEVLLAGILVVAGIRMSEQIPGTLHLLSFLVLTGAGIAVIYSLWIVMIALTFWFIKLDNNVTILAALLDAGRYPATVYPIWLRMIVTFIIPIALATTVPIQALRGDLTGAQVLMYLGIAAGSLFLSSSIWKAGVRRYSGASS